MFLESFFQLLIPRTNTITIQWMCIYTIVRCISLFDSFLRHDSLSFAFFSSLLFNGILLILCSVSEKIIDYWIKRFLTTWRERRLNGWFGKCNARIGCIRVMMRQWEKKNIEKVQTVYVSINVTNAYAHALCIQIHLRLHVGTMKCDMKQSKKYLSSETFQLR